MSNPQVSKTRGAGSKPQSSSSTTPRSTLRSGTSAPGPSTSPQTPGDSVSLLSAPKNVRDAKALLCQTGYLLSKTESSTAGICSGLLTSIAVHPEVTPTVCALITSVGLILPEAFGVLYASTRELSGISDKLDRLISHTDELPASTPQGLAIIEEKLELVTQGIQKATETWQTVPPRSRTRTPHPVNPPSAPPTAPPGPTRAGIAKERRLKSQGCFVLVEPTSPAIKESLNKLDACTLVKKAEMAWDATWDSVKGTNTAKDLGLVEKPRMAFKTALRLARGGIRYELGDRTQAALLSNARVASEFEKGFGGASCRGQGATILLQCAPVDFNPEDPAAIPRFVDKNQLSKGDVLLMTWCKPPQKRKPDQTMAVLKLEMRLHDLADRLITEGGQLDCQRVLFTKARQEPTQCLRCQKYGHKAAKCTNGTKDVCSRCGEGHRIANCSNPGKKWCVPCQTAAHCSFERDCPSFQAECNQFNKRHPENGNTLFGPPHPHNPRHCPINYPPPLMSEMFPDGNYTSLAVNQNRCIREMAPRHPAWTSREHTCKIFGQGEAWEADGVMTAPHAPVASGSNTIPSRARSPAPHLPVLPTQMSTPPPQGYSPLQPAPTTPQQVADILGVLPAPVCAYTNNSLFVYDVTSPTYPLHRSTPYARGRAPSVSSNASTATITQ